MRIATWNLERLKHKANLSKILSEIHRVDADILVLTETCSSILLDYTYSFHTPPLVEIQPSYYRPKENRISIFTRYKGLKQYSTYNEYSALCIELETEKGNLLVYGTIMGIFGNRHPSFQQDLIQIIADFKRLSAIGKLCICGDYNCSFSDNYYFTQSGRDIIRQSFKENSISLLTHNQPECIDHIAISNSFPVEHYQIMEWNTDKCLSDHKGIYIDIQ